MSKKIKLDRTYIHSGNFLGPGEVEVSDEVHADLIKAQARQKKRDDEIARSKRAIDDSNDANLKAQGIEPGPRSDSKTTGNEPIAPAAVKSALKSDPPK